MVMVGLQLLVHRTWIGKAMRALSMNVEAARLMGIRTGRVIAFTFALGSSLAALGAVLYCLDQSQVYPTMGVVIGTRAFVAAVLGGIGSIPGAMLGGVLIGIIGELVKLTDYSGGPDVLVFVVLILVLLVGPRACSARPASRRSDSMLGLGLAALFIILNGFFVAAEFSLVKLRATRGLPRRRKGGARHFSTTRSRLDRYLGVTQLAITL